jgi:hypothetical protein
MANEMRDLLESVARELARHAVTFPNELNEWREVCWKRITEEQAYKFYLAVLTRRLLPLLEAGEAMRNGMSPYSKYDWEHGLQEWDAAKAKAMGGK